MDISVRPENNSTKARKKTRNPSSWKKNKAKLERYKPKSLPEYPTCEHKGAKYQCKSLTMEDIRLFHKHCYRKHDKHFQDNFVLRHVEIKNIKRRRPKNSKYSPRNYAVNYYVLNNRKEKVTVCCKAFTDILRISRHRINRLVENYQKNGFVEEKRGGFRRVAEFQNQRESVMKFINSLQCLESHYCRERKCRKYLSTDLNIKKLWKMYSNLENVTPVKHSYFRMIFNTKYNLGFGTPRLDVCSTCLQLDEKIKFEKNEKEKQTLRVEKRVHKLRANAFFDLLKDTDNKKLILSFDCQKNLPLPKLPDQSTYYSRQVYLHNFTVVRGHSKSKQNLENVTAYCWTENQFDKGSNTIASCLFDVLINTDFSNYNTVRLISDGCSGQNKNSTLITMCMMWLAQKAPVHINEIEIVFPVTGHSFLPPDRVFGQIEKKLKKHEVIATPEEIIAIISQHSTVKSLGKDCQIYNFKESMTGVIKRTSGWHFQLSKCKRIFIKRTKSNIIQVKGECHYRVFLGLYKGLFMQRKGPFDIIPHVIKEKNEISVEKKTDVLKLLTAHYGANWENHENLKFFKHVLSSDSTADEECDLCETREEETDLMI